MAFETLIPNSIRRIVQLEHPFVGFSLGRSLCLNETWRLVNVSGFDESLKLALEFLTPES
jgi:hypothetical protein